MSAEPDIVDAVVVEAGPAAVLVVLQERDVQSLGRAIVDDLGASVVDGLLGGGETTVRQGEWATFVTANDAAGKVLASRQLPGRKAMALLPRALHLARSTGRTVDVRTPDLTRCFVGASVLAAAHEPRRDEAALVAQLRRGGWNVTVEPNGINLWRGRVGRELGMAILMLLCVTLFLPLTILVVAFVAFAGRATMRSLARHWAAPFRRVDERLRIEIGRGTLRWAVWRDGVVAVDRTLDEGQLLAVHADGPFDTTVVLVERTATSALPCLARGEPTQSFRPPQSDALADLIVRTWAKPAPGYRG